MVATINKSKRRTALKAGIVGLACVLVTLWSGSSVAELNALDDDGSFFARLMDLDGDGALETDEGNFLGEPPLSASSSATFNSRLTVQVDQTYCATVGVQCDAADGHTFNEAGPTNHNPVRLGIQVVVGGPINGLVTGDFDVFNPYVPAGASAVERVTCASCFQAAGDGLYTIFVHPAAEGADWKSGSYFVQVQVTVGPSTLRALAQIDIPF